jgi:uncharacterized protein YaeQ
VAVYTYGTGAELWWKQNAAAMERLANVTVVDLPVETTRAMAARAARNMKLQCTIQDGHVWLADDETSLTIEPVVRKAAA